MGFRLKEKEKERTRNNGWSIVTMPPPPFKISQFSTHLQRVIAARFPRGVTSTPFLFSHLCSVKSMLPRKHLFVLQRHRRDAHRAHLPFDGSVPKKKTQHLHIYENYIALRKVQIILQFERSKWSDSRPLHMFGMCVCLNSQGSLSHFKVIIMRPY